MSHQLPMLNGSLRDKVRKVISINSMIESIRAEGIRESSSLDNLLERRVELEVDIHRHLMQKEKITNPLLDYCFRCFGGFSYMDGNERKKIYFTAFNQIPKVKEFLKEVRKYKGQKILVTSGGKTIETGLISGPAQFSVEETFRYLHVPVQQLYFKEGNGWQKGREQYDTSSEKMKTNNSLVYINPDIFKHPAPIFMSFPFKRIGEIFHKNSGRAWLTDHSKEIYIGEDAPDETGIYLGDKFISKTFSRAKFPGRL